MCFEYTRRMSFRKLTFATGICVVLNSTIIMSYSLTILTLPMDRWESVYHDLRADRITDFSVPSSRLFTYLFAWTARGVRW